MPPRVVARTTPKVQWAMPYVRRLTHPGIIVLNAASLRDATTKKGHICTHFHLKTRTRVQAPLSLGAAQGSNRFEIPCRTDPGPDKAQLVIDGFTTYSVPARYGFVSTAIMSTVIVRWLSPTPWTINFDAAGGAQRVEKPRPRPVDPPGGIVVAHVVGTLDQVARVAADLRQDLLQLLEDSACLGLGARAYCPEM